MGEGPYSYWTLIFCRSDEAALATVAAFPDDVEAIKHARLRLLARPDEWFSIVVARGGNDNVEMMGAWDRDHEGALTWQDGSLA